MSASFTPTAVMPAKPATVGEVGHLTGHQMLHDAVLELRAGLTKALADIAAGDAAQLAASLLTAAGDPAQMAVGTITLDSASAPLSHAVRWPDGSIGTYTGAASSAFPGTVDSYTITRVVGNVTTKYTQPKVTRNSVGVISNRPAITVA